MQYNKPIFPTPKHFIEWFLSAALDVNILMRLNNSQDSLSKNYMKFCCFKHFPGKKEIKNRFLRLYASASIMMKVFKRNNEKRLIWI